MTIYQFRTYPTTQQLSALNRFFKVHCELYNLAFSENQRIYKATGKGPGRFDQIKDLLAKFNKRGTNYSSLQQTIRRFYKSLDAFFKRGYGFPRKKQLFSTIEFSKHGDGWSTKNGLYIQGLGQIKVNWHRPVFGVPQRLSITKKRDGKIFVSITTDFIPTVPANLGSSVGIDLGLKTFIVTSDGQKIDHPCPFLKKLKGLRKVHRQIKKSIKGSRRKRKKQRILTKLHQKIANQRKDFLHKLSKKLVDKYGAIAVEELKIKNFDNRFPNMNRKQRDMAWNEFIKMLEYKSFNAGVAFKKVDPAYTTQTCFNCGKVELKSLKRRIHNCNCGYTADRDINAARNILKKAFPLNPGTTGFDNDLVLAHAEIGSSGSPRIYPWE